MGAIEPCYDRLRDSKDFQSYRRSMIDFFFAHGENVSETARAFGTSRVTVLKWIQRFRKQGQRRLRDLSRRPHRCPHKTPPQHEQLIAKLRTNRGQKTKTRIGQDKIKLLLKQRHGLDISSSTINRVLDTLKLIRPRRRKCQKKREIALYRKLLKALGFWQVGVKYLNDIPSIYFLVLRRIFPKYEYTMRDVVTGTTFVCYAHQLSSLNSARFIALCLDHFRRYGLDLSQITIQTDNRPDFVRADN